MYADHTQINSQSNTKLITMETKFRLKIVNIRESLQQGDITKIATNAGVSVTTVQKMFNSHEFNELKPAMKLALNAAIDFVELKKIEHNREMERIMES